MVDLFLLRELIRNESARCHDDDVCRIFDQAGFDCLFGNILARASLPNRPADIALPSSLMGVKTIHARSRCGATVQEFPESYTSRINRPIRLDFVPTNARSTLK